MEVEIKYQGTKLHSDDIQFINQLISNNPNASRRQISQLVCEAWNWRQANGYLKNMFCRSLLLHLDRCGYIKLPPVRCRPNNPLANRNKPPTIELDKTPLYNYEKIAIIQVRRTSDENLYDRLIEQYHYLGYGYPIGEYLKYIFFITDRPIGCICFCSAVRHITCRDQYIGWSKQQREANLHLIAYNTRFLILAWVSIYCLASQLLSNIAKILPQDWERYFNHSIYYLETFVDSDRFGGTCYQAYTTICNCGYKTKATIPDEVLVSNFGGHI